MAGSINKVILVGNLGKDPEIRHSQDGAKIASFSIATSETWKDKVTNEKRDNTQWHRIVVFNENLANIVENYIKKGNKVYIEGALQYRKYTGQDGVERNISEVVLTRFRGDIQILDSRQSQVSTTDSYEHSFEDKSNNSMSGNKVYNKQNEESFKNNSNFDTDIDDDIPF